MLLTTHLVSSVYLVGARVRDLLQRSWGLVVRFQCGGAVQSKVPVAVLVGFSPLERAGLGLLLDEHGFTVKHVRTGLASVDLAPGEICAALLDLEIDGTETPGGSRSFRSAVTMFRAQHPAARVIGVHRSCWLNRPRREVDLDLHAIVEGDAGVDRLLAAIRGTDVDEPTAATSLMTAKELTTREREVFVLIATGCTSRAIADSLGISTHTVESHKQRVFRRLGVQSQAQAVAIAMRLGLLESTRRLSGAGS
jgi:DNA-binding NarL/FixJ family response regulator